MKGHISARMDCLLREMASELLAERMQEDMEKKRGKVATPKEMRRLKNKAERLVDQVLESEGADQPASSHAQQLKGGMDQNG